MKEGAYYVDGYSINKTEFGERIKSAREELKMTQTQLAQLLKTSQTTVAKYEHGEQIPRADVLAAISKATGKSADWLLFGNIPNADKRDVSPEQWLKHLIDLLLDSPVDTYIDHDVEGGRPCRVPYYLMDFGTRPLDEEFDCGVSVGLYGPDMYNLFNMIDQIKKLNEGFTPELIDAVKLNICKKYGHYFTTATEQANESILDENGDIIF